jgi:hypothetical protein
MSVLSPDVNIKEQDFSGIVPTVATTQAAIAGKFNQGPLNSPVLVSSEDDLVATFGTPDDSNYMEWHCAAEFLKYSSSLYVTRAVPAGILNATQSGTGYLIDNADTFYALTSAQKQTIGTFAAKNSGLSGNDLGVIIVDSQGWSAFVLWAGSISASMPNGVTFDKYFTTQPGTTQYVSGFASNPTDEKYDEVHVLIFDATGKITGTPYTVLETWQGLSKAVDATDYAGQPLYAVDKINQASKYVWMLTFPTPMATKTATVSTASVLNGIATITTLAAHNFNVGDTITIASVVSSGPGSYNGTFTITTVPTTTTFTVSNASLPGTYTSGGTVTMTISANAEDANAGIYATDIAPSGYTFAPFDFHSVNNAYSLETQLAGAVAGTAPQASDIITAYSKYANKDLIDVGHIITAGHPMSVIQYCAQTLAYGRGDSMAYSSVYNTNPGTPIKDTDVSPEQEAVSCKSSWNIAEQYAQYMVVDSGYKYIYDKYVRKYRWIPLNGDIAGIAARLGFIAEEWYSPGGFNRGGLKNVIKLAFNPSLPQRDVIYPKGINPVVNFANQGPVLYGDRTGTTKPSAFDRYNVRRLFIILEKSIAIAAKYQLFEFNDVFTRAQFRNMVEPFLRNIQGKRGITDFLVRCDETNNTAQVIDSNQFVGEIYIKPARSINTITLTFVATRSDVQFSTLIG